MTGARRSSEPGVTKALIKEEQANDDACLLELTRSGDTEAFRRFFERKHRLVYLTAYQMLGDTATAEEIVQETFLALWQHSDRFRPGFSVDAWIRRITTNKAIDRWRARRRRAEAFRDAAPRPDRGQDPSGRARWHEVQAIWNELADLLPSQQRAAFLLKEIEDRPVGEVAEVLGCSRSAVRSHVSLARKTLQRALAERYPEFVSGLR